MRRRTGGESKDVELTGCCRRWEREKGIKETLGSSGSERQLTGY